MLLRPGLEGPWSLVTRHELLTRGVGWRSILSSVCIVKRKQAVPPCGQPQAEHPQKQVRSCGLPQTVDIWGQALGIPFSPTHPSLAAGRVIGLPGRRTRVAPLGRPERRLVRAAGRSGADKPRPSGVEWRHRRPGSDFVDGVAAVSQRIRESNGTAFGRRVLSRRQVPATGIWARRAKGASPRLAA